MFYRTLAALLAFWLGANLLPASEATSHIIVDKWTTDDGLPQNSVITMTQGREGFLWLGTLDGLVRFDGLNITSFNESNTPQLTGNEIVHIFQDSHGVFWIGTRSDGILMLQNGRATNIGIGRGSREGRLMAACEDASGNVWLYTADGQLCRYRNEKLDVFNFGNSGERFSNCRTMIAEKGGLVWVGTDTVIYGVDPNAEMTAKDLPVRQVLRLTPLSHLDLLLASKHGGYWMLAGGRVEKWRGAQREKDWSAFQWSKPIFSACEDLEGNLIVGTLGDGLWWYDAQGKASKLSSAEGLSHDYILSLLVDQQGTLWIGTDGGGLNRVRHQPFIVLPDTESVTVQSVVDDTLSGLWLNSKDGVKHWKNSHVETYGIAQGMLNINGRVIMVDSSKKVWAGSGGPLGKPGVFQLRNNHFEVVPGLEKMNPEVSAIFQDSHGNVWLGTQGGLLRWDGREWKPFSLLDGLSSEAVQALTEDSYGNLWIGTKGGLTRLTEGKFTAYHQRDGLAGEDISSLCADEDGTLWIATRGRGLGRLKNGKFSRFTKDEGLLNENLGYLLDDKAGSLWLGSHTGLMRIPKKELTDVALGLTNSFSCRAYGKEDGLLSSECTTDSQPGPCRTDDGKLWFPTIKGVASIDLTELKLNTNAPPVFIEAVNVKGFTNYFDSLLATLPSQINLPYDVEQIRIHYTCLNLSGSRKSRFKYRMQRDGHETPWTEVDGLTRVATISPLPPPGAYHFQVIAGNEDNVWNNLGASLAFIIQPPFWQRWWFLTLISLIVLGVTASIVNYFLVQRLQRQLEGMRQVEALEKERSRIARDIHDQLGASLTQVSLLGEMVESDKNHPDEVEEHAKQIIQTSRDTARALDQIVWTVNPSNDTVEGLINYICKYAQEYLAVADLRYRLDVPPQLPDTQISPEVRHNVFLASKEAITNIVKHAKATEALLRLRIETSKFILEIQDNGRGPSGLEAKNNRNGLRNMNKRMEDLGGSFEFTAVPEGGTLIRLTVPINQR